MLCSNYNVYIIWYLHIMVSTYYIYYIVTTYYVVNGITIIKYLHNGDCHKCGKSLTMSPLCATGKWGFCVCVRHAMRRTMRAIRYRLGQRVRRELTMRERACVSIDWVWDSLGVCPIHLSPQKKYVFSGMLGSHAWRLQSPRHWETVQ